MRSEGRLGGQREATWLYEFAFSTFIQLCPFDAAGSRLSSLAICRVFTPRRAPSYVGRLDDKDTAKEKRKEQTTPKLDPSLTQLLEDELGGGVGREMREAFWNTRQTSDRRRRAVRFGSAYESGLECRPGIASKARRRANPGDSYHLLRQCFPCHAVAFFSSTFSPVVWWGGESGQRLHTSILHQPQRPRGRSVWLVLSGCIPTALEDESTKGVAPNDEVEMRQQKKAPEPDRGVLPGPCVCMCMILWTEACLCASIDGLLQAGKLRFCLLWLSGWEAVELRWCSALHGRNPTMEACIC